MPSGGCSLLSPTSSPTEGVESLFFCLMDGLLDQHIQPVECFFCQLYMFFRYCGIRPSVYSDCVEHACHQAHFRPHDLAEPLSLRHLFFLSLNQYRTAPFPTLSAGSAAVCVGGCLLFVASTGYAVN